MTAIVTRSGKGSALSWTEVDTNFTNLNTDKAEKSVVDLKAPLDSPELTGIPTAPTATSGTSTTQIATTAFVQAKTATQTPFTTTGNIAASNVQAAIEELDTEKLALTGGTVTGQIKGITPVSSEDLTRKDYVDGLTATSFVHAISGNTTIGTTFTAFPTWSKTSEINGGTLAAGGGWNPPIKGIYQINYVVNFASSGVTAASIQAQLRRNGTVVDSVGTGAGSAIYPVLNGGVLLNLLTTDTVDVGSLINVGTAANVSAKFTATLVRPVP